MSKTKPDQSQADATPPVVHVPPIDPGDAGGVGNSTERVIAPGALHETHEEVKARGGMWGRA